MALFITAAKGTEVPLRDELRELRLPKVRADRGGVRVAGGIREAAKVCLHSRIAVRALIEVDSFECPDEDALYDGIADIDWTQWLEPGRTLAVTSVCRDSKLRHTAYIAQRTKDAIVDAQRSRFGQRSSVDRRDPDVAIFVRLYKNHAQVFLDASGRSLHLRGWRTRGGPAPLKETLAAAILRISGWDRESPLLDPMCGSGTLPIEAELWARRVPTHPRRHRFGFERWADFDARAADVFAEMRDAAFDAILDEGPHCSGSDIDIEQIGRARDHANRAAVRARFQHQPLDKTQPSPDRRWLVVNPPYGQRLELSPNLQNNLRRLAAENPRSTLSVLLPRDAKLRLRGRGAPLVQNLNNGPIECALVTWNSLES